MMSEPMVGEIQDAIERQEDWSWGDLATREGEEFDLPGIGVLEVVGMVQQDVGRLVLKLTPPGGWLEARYFIMGGLMNCCGGGHWGDFYEATPKQKVVTYYARKR